MYFLIRNEDGRIVGTSENTDIPKFLENDHHYELVDSVVKSLNTNDGINIITQIMEKAGIYADIIDFDDEELELSIQIEWGDWKHDHLFCDNIMEALGYDVLAETVTDEDGSDCYSATHDYKKTV